MANDDKDTKAIDAHIAVRKSVIAAEGGGEKRSKELEHEIEKPELFQNGFAQLLRAEWTKFRTVRGWVIGMVVAALVIVLLGLLLATLFKSSCEGPNGLVESGGTFTVTGTGDIAPLGSGWTIERTLIGTFAGAIGVIVVAVMFSTAEAGRGLIGVTLLASTRPRRVLAAKAIVIGTVTFIAGLAAAIVVVPLGKRILRANGNDILPVTPLTELRIIVGTAALLAVAAVFALALGTLFRRSLPAVITAIAVLVLPYLLAISSVLPREASQWLLRLTPAAAFAIQQSLPEYPQVIGLYVPVAGYYPLAPWAGFAVLCGYTALVLGLAVLVLRRSDT
jgi:hypothetical protein